MAGISTTEIDRAGAYRIGGVVLLVSLATIVAALGFEHIGGYLPCPLCLQQRYAYYAGVPAAFAALVLLSNEQPRMAAMLFFALALAFLANSGLGIYQAGAEWEFWPGPESCAADQGISSSAEGLLETFDDTKVVSCTDPQWRLFGLSFAGWNAVVSFVLFVGALKAAFLSVGKR